MPIVFFCFMCGLFFMFMFFMFFMFYVYVYVELCYGLGQDSLVKEILNLNGIIPGKIIIIK